MASTTMAIARAFTKRTRKNRANSDEDSTPMRGKSMRYIDRNLISLPTELISTTNVHALTAPDISSLNGSSGASIGSSNDSDFSTIDRSFLNTPMTSADNSSIDSSSPVTPITPMDSEAKDFFGSTSKRSATTAGTRTSATTPSLEAPAIPQRALSHSKKNALDVHASLSRKRSTQRMSPPPNSLSRPSSSHNTTDIFSGPASSEHPFRKELAQVNEVADEFGLSSTFLAEEEREMTSKGLKKFGVEDYLDEIAELYGGIYEDQLGPMARPWF